MRGTISDPQGLQSPDSQTPSSRPKSKGSTTSKLRDSCHACALSKVKCHKQKPTCSRCAERNLNCEYFHSKRPGRKRESRGSISTDSNNEIINIDTPVSSGSKEQRTNAVPNSVLSITQEYLNQLLSPVESLKPDNMSAIECSISTTSNSCSSSSGLVLGDLLNMPGSGLSANHTGLSTNFESFFGSPQDFLEFEPLNESPIYPHSGIDISKLLIPDDIIPLPVPELSPTNHNNVIRLSDSQSLSTHQDLCGPQDSATCCLMPALDLMKSLSVRNSTPNEMSPAQVGGTNPSSSPAQSVVEDTKQAIEVVTSMTKCACAEDGYLLAVLSMLVLKIIARFGTVVLKQPSDMAANIRHDEGATRTTAQLVLGELHRVQRLINQLSPRLQSYNAILGGSWEVPGRQGTGREFRISTYARGDMKTAPFSATILEQLEIGLRKAVSGLSTKLIYILRQS